MTNLEKIRGTGTWEPAGFIHRVSNGEAEITECKNECQECSMSDGWCISGIGEWLLSETEDADMAVINDDGTKEYVDNDDAGIDMEQPAGQPGQEPGGTV